MAGEAAMMAASRMIVFIVSLYVTDGKNPLVCDTMQFYSQNPSMKPVDLTGQRFGRLVAQSRGPNAGKGRSAKARWYCLCDCGNTTLVYTSALRGGLTTSCGCWRSEVSTKLAGPLNRSHGKSATAAFARWIGMRQRCFNPNRKDWHVYGGRGITICERWMSFENFYADMGDPPPGMQIERVDNNGNYEPGNCIWATPTQQGRNRRTNRVIRAKGQAKPMSAWAEDIGSADNTIADRLERGWSPDEAVSVDPTLYHRRKKPSDAA